MAAPYSCVDVIPSWRSDPTACSAGGPSGHSASRARSVQGPAAPVADRLALDAPGAARQPRRLHRPAHNPATISLSSSSVFVPTTLSGEPEISGGPNQPGPAAAPKESGCRVTSSALSASARRTDRMRRPVCTKLSGIRLAVASDEDTALTFPRNFAPLPLSRR